MNDKLWKNLPWDNEYDSLWNYYGQGVNSSQFKNLQKCFKDVFNLNISFVDNSMTYIMADMVDGIPQLTIQTSTGAKLKITGLRPHQRLQMKKGGSIKEDMQDRIADINGTIILSAVYTASQQGTSTTYYFGELAIVTDSVYSYLYNNIPYLNKTYDFMSLDVTSQNYSVFEPTKTESSINTWNNVEYNRDWQIFNIPHYKINMIDISGGGNKNLTNKEQQDQNFCFNSAFNYGIDKSSNVLYFNYSNKPEILFSNIDKDLTGTESIQYVIKCVDDMITINREVYNPISQTWGVSDTTNYTKDKLQQFVLVYNPPAKYDIQIIRNNTEISHEYYSNVIMSSAWRYHTYKYYPIYNLSISLQVSKKQQITLQTNDVVQIGVQDTKPYILINNIQPVGQSIAKYIDLFCDKTNNIFNDVKVKEEQHSTSRDVQTEHYYWTYKYAGATNIILTPNEEQFKLWKDYKFNAVNTQTVGNPLLNPNATCTNSVTIYPVYGHLEKSGPIKQIESVNYNSSGNFNDKTLSIIDYIECQVDALPMYDFMLLIA